MSLDSECQHAYHAWAAIVTRHCLGKIVSEVEQIICKFAYGPAIPRGSYLAMVMRKQRLTSALDAQEDYFVHLLEMEFGTQRSIRLDHCSPCLDSQREHRSSWVICGQRLASINARNEILIHNLFTGRLVRTLTAPYASLGRDIAMSRRYLVASSWVPPPDSSSSSVPPFPERPVSIVVWDLASSAVVPQEVAAITMKVGYPCLEMYFAVDETTVYHTTGVQGSMFEFPANRTVAARSVANGELLWKNIFKSNLVICELSVSTDVLFVGTGDPNAHFIQVWFLDPVTGHVKHSMAVLNSGGTVSTYKSCVGFASSQLEDVVIPAEYQPGLRLWANFGRNDIFFADGNYSRIGLCSAWVAGACEVEVDEAWEHDQEETKIDVYRWTESTTIPFRCFQHRLGKLCYLAAVVTSSQAQTELVAKRILDAPTKYSEDTFWCWLTSIFCSRRRVAQQGNGISEGAQVVQQGDGIATNYQESSSAPDYADSNLELVSDEVSHAGEPPATIDPEEASHVASELWASQIESFARFGNDNTFDTLGRAKEVIVLALTKHSKAIEDILLDTVLAQSLLSRGVDVKPSWACGAKVFVEHLSHGDLAEFRLFFGQRVGPGVNHVVVCSEDEHLIHEALRPLRGHRRLASLKHGGRIEAPVDHSADWFECSENDCASLKTEEFTWPAELTDEDTQPLIPTLPLFRIVIKNTFIHVDYDDEDFQVPPAREIQTP